MLRNIDGKLERVLDWQEEQRDRLAKIDALNALTKKVEALEAKPRKRWEMIVLAVLTGLVCFFAGRHKEEKDEDYE